MTAKYDKQFCYTEQGWISEPIELAGKKHPEVRQHPATCFLTHSLLLHGGLSGKGKDLGDFYIL
jgi:hypothetical protein